MNSYASNEYPDCQGLGCAPWLQPGRPLQDGRRAQGPALLSAAALQALAWPSPPATPLLLYCHRKFTVPDSFGVSCVPADTAWCCNLMMIWRRLSSCSKVSLSVWHTFEAASARPCAARSRRRAPRSAFWGACSDRLWVWAFSSSSDGDEYGRLFYASECMGFGTPLRPVWHKPG